MYKAQHAHDMRRATTPPEPGWAQSAAVTLIDSPAAAQELGRHLLDVARTVPVVLVTRAAGQAAAAIDSARINAEVSGHVEVYEMVTGAPTWAFSGALSQFPGTECYGGAGRVYPVGVEWTTDLDLSPLRFAYSDEAARRATDLLIADALTAAFRSGYVTHPTAAPILTGTVTGVVSGRGLVRLDHGGLASIWPELTLPGVDADQLVVKDMRVEGVHDETAGRLDVSAMAVPAAEALSYAPGDVVLGRVVALERQLCILEIYPDVQAPLTPDQVVDPDRVPAETIDLRQWFTEGETVTARVLTRGQGSDDWELSLLDLDATEDPPQVAPAILRGGPPWLTPPIASTLAAPVAGDGLDGAASPAAILMPPAAINVQAAPEQAPEAEAGADQLRAMADERDILAHQLDRSQRLIASRDDELRSLRTKARALQQSLDQARKRLSGVQQTLLDHEADRAAFSDPEAQFRYEVELAWARRIPAAEKKQAKLAAYTLLPQFLDTLGALGERDRDKTVDVVVEILTGRVYTMPGRETHQLRTGTGGDDPYLTRDDGATCWRVYLQHKTPQARRLHFWIGPDGGIDLSSVRQHDDVRP